MFRFTFCHTPRHFTPAHTPPHPATPHHTPPPYLTPRATSTTIPQPHPPHLPLYLSHTLHTIPPNNTSRHPTTSFDTPPNHATYTPWRFTPSLIPPHLTTFYVTYTQQRTTAPRIIPLIAPRYTPCTTPHLTGRLLPPTRALSPTAFNLIFNPKKDAKLPKKLKFILSNSHFYEKILKNFAFKSIFNPNFKVFRYFYVKNRLDFAFKRENKGKL